MGYRPILMADRAAPRIQIAPSILPADLARLGEEVEALEAAGCDRIQWDIMDGQFVPNITVGPDVVAAARRHTSLPFEAHLMTLTPELLAAEFVEAGCERLIVHAESVTHLHRSLDHVRSVGATAGVALAPATPAIAVRHVLDLVDLVLVMTVNPGFGGQDYLASMEPKVAEVRGMVQASGFADRRRGRRRHQREDGGRRRGGRGQRPGGRQRAVPPSRRPRGRGGRAPRAGRGRLPLPLRRR